MTDKMVDVGGRRRPPTFFFPVRRHSHQRRAPTSARVLASVGECRPPTSAKLADTHADVGRRRRPECQRVSASVVRRHCRSSFPTLRSTSADDTCRHSPTLRPTSAADVGVSVGLSVGKLDRQCWRPTLADTQADTQSVTLVKTTTRSISNEGDAR